MSAVSVTPRASWIRSVTSRAQIENPALVDWMAAVATSVLLVLSFPNFELSFLAWIGLVPLILAIARRPSPVRALILGWTAGTIFFYGSCYWLTYSMIHYGGLPAVVAYLMLIPGAIVVGFFPGIFALLLAVVIQKWGSKALLLAPFIWVASEYARLGVTGQLWNAIGYSQAYHPSLIQVARWGGVYAVGFSIVAANVFVAWVAIKRSTRALVMAAFAITLIFVLIFAADKATRPEFIPDTIAEMQFIALQPNVPMDLIKTEDEFRQLTERHFEMTQTALSQAKPLPTVVIWPESPMNFTYTTDRQFQELVTAFARERQISLLFNSQEPAPGGGTYNSAVLINEEGRRISQYDKIRLLPFGEYVPLPRWLPGASLITAIVGDFTPGVNYTLMPVAGRRAGVFICIESAYPSIPRTLAMNGADVLINISNDGYLGPTAVMRQHLANAVFRAVENGRPVVRVTNSGITAMIYPNGSIVDETSAFTPDVRVWLFSTSFNAQTFYTKRADLFVIACAIVTALIAISVFVRRKGPESNI